VERLLELAAKDDVSLVMPRLGEPVEPSHAEAVEAWWRVVDAGTPDTEVFKPAAVTVSKAVPWPID
jgi:hypothetical protein